MSQTVHHRQLHWTVHQSTIANSTGRFTRQPFNPAHMPIRIVGNLEPAQLPFLCLPYRRDGDSLEAFYAIKYPGINVPTPQELEDEAFIAPMYYSVVAGKNIGIFSNWGDVGPIMQGFPGNNQKKHPTWLEAWLAYSGAYNARQVQILDKGGDIARYGAELVNLLCKASLGP
ncbi:hypothetical protein V5O48_018079 [Marasmius crinis-equi]|uniref:Ribonuclease H1 N-terminal domain-containing protein n=1 Tax=Marasmius crinis-equi TaxID=585013 RepID=A0ABR3EMD6_9AGAR